MKKNPQEILTRHLLEMYDGLLTENQIQRLPEFKESIKAMDEYKYGNRVNPLFWRVVTRILMFLPWLSTIVVGHFVEFCKQLVNYVRYGGESITYTYESRSRMIVDVFDKVSELVDKK